MELIKILFTDEDVRSLAEEAGISEEEALKRASDWAKHIESTATELCNEQLASVIQFNTP